MHIEPGKTRHWFPLALLIVAATGPAHAGDVARAFEADLNNSAGGAKFTNSVMPRIDTRRYTNFVLKWEGKTGDTGCVIYGALEGNAQRIFAIKMVRKNGQWVVNGTNVMPGNDASAYDSWIRFHGCRK